MRWKKSLRCWIVWGLVLVFVSLWAEQAQGVARFTMAKAVEWALRENKSVCAAHSGVETASSGVKAA